MKCFMDIHWSCFYLQPSAGQITKCFIQKKKKTNITVSLWELGMNSLFTFTFLNFNSFNIHGIFQNTVHVPLSHNLPLVSNRLMLTLMSTQSVWRLCSQAEELMQQKASDYATYVVTMYQQNEKIVSTVQAAILCIFAYIQDYRCTCILYNIFVELENRLKKFQTLLPTFLIPTDLQLKFPTIPLFFFLEIKWGSKLHAVL